MIKRCTENDVSTLQEISIQTFSETFEHDNEEQHLQAYLDKAYNIEKLREELSNVYSFFYFIKHQDTIAGYLKVNVKDAQTEAVGENALEVERIYIRKEFQKLGLGKELLNYAFAVAHEQQVSKVWLGVWEENKNALAFYNKNGFIKSGQHSFFMGEDEQIDWIMEKQISK